MKGASNIASLGVRLPDDLKIKIQERARKNGRSMNSEIVQILQDAINRGDTPQQASYEEIKAVIDKLFDDAMNGNQDK